MLYQTNKITYFLKICFCCFISLGFIFFILTNNLSTFAQTPNVSPPKIAPSIPGSPLADDSEKTPTSQAAVSSITQSSPTTSNQPAIQAPPKTETPTTQAPAANNKNNAPQDFLPKETPRSGGLESLILVIPAAGASGLIYFYKKNVYRQKKKLTTTENKIKNHL